MFGGILFCFLLPPAYAQTLIDTQDEAFPLYTELDSVALKPYEKLFQFGQFSLAKCIKFRHFLKPYVDKKDPKALYLYAKAFDWYPFGYGDPESAQIALKYYHKAADLHYAEAEMDLYGIYYYGFMNLPEDKEKGIAYLRRTIQHGDTKNKLTSLYHLAGILKPTYPDSALYYLNQMLTLDTAHTNALDYIASIHEENKEYEGAAYYMRKSSNKQIQLKLATWLIVGDKVEKNIVEGLDIIHTINENSTEEEMRSWAENQPKILLCRLYRCEKLITKEQLRGIDVEKYGCCF